MFICSFRVRGGWLWVGGGPSDFIVNQSPNLWIFGLKTFDLDFSLDNKFIQNKQ